MLKMAVVGVLVSGLAVVQLFAASWDPAWLPKYPNEQAKITKASPVKDIAEYFKAELARAGVPFRASFDGIGVSIRADDNKIDCLIRVHETADGPTFVERGCTPRDPNSDLHFTSPPIVPVPHYGVTMSDFNRIASGMSYGEVTAILGAGRVLSHSEIAGYVTTMYGWANHDGSNMNVMVQDDRVVSKAQAGLR